LVVQVREHDPLPMTEYQGMLRELAEQVAREWERRSNRRPSGES
jgi:hypothetical protein